MKLKYPLLMAAAIVLFGCNKNNSTGPTLPATKYSGRFIADEKSDPFSTGPITNAITVTFNGSRYSSAAEGSPFAADARGSFKISGNTIQLVDSLAHPANFDFGLVLSGTYSYTTKSDSLVMIKTAGQNTYTYKLKKVN